MGQERFFLHPEEFGRALVPRVFRPRLRRYLLKAGYYEVPYKTYGLLFYLSIAITMIILGLFFFPYLDQYPLAAQMVLIFIFWVIIQLAVVLLLGSLTYVYYDLLITKRTQAMDDILEEFLRYVSENLKGGMSFERALWSAIRNKFGILAEEVRLIAKKVMTGQDIDDAMLEFTEKYDSPMLKRSFQLIVEGLKGGGRISDIIDKTEQNIRQTKELKREMITTNRTYEIFLTFIVLVIAPVLFSLSFALVRILKSLASRMQFTSMANSSFQLDLTQLVSNPHLESAFVHFSTGALIILAVSTSIILSIIRNGNMKGSLKYIPSYILISLLMYAMFKSIFLAMFGAMM